MQDPELKKELDKIPDVDENGDPIYKIDNVDPSEETTLQDIEIPPAIGDLTNEAQGNLQDIKNSTTEEQSSVFYEAGAKTKNPINPD